jgi:hypothetical protein
LPDDAHRQLRGLVRRGGQPLARSRALRRDPAQPQGWGVGRLFRELFEALTVPKERPNAQLIA